MSLFSCFPISSGSSFEEARGGRLSHCWRHVVRSLTRFWHVSHWEAKSERERAFLHGIPMLSNNGADYVEQMICYLPTAVQRDDRVSLCLFLALYPKFATTWEVLDLILKRYGTFRPDDAENQQTKTAIFSFLSQWLQKFPQDFCGAPDLAVVRRLLDYARIHVPTAEVDCQAGEILRALEEQEGKRLKPGEKEEEEGEEPGLGDAR
ncbi:ral guanine nucleotide dissociation stimulator-like [Psammomys obesus]|uniref:ral guanine nucleotide dissociation stimulator-like n=1 Tax=Psammomys obesus TaxID=48139 RepID=UPI002452BA59|nr:ral guanine nucleotide dissociation stimulator-like [Psammomys obesus]